MNKLPDISRDVMDRVTGFEKKRSTSWFARYFIILGIMGSTFFGLCVFTYYDLYKKNTWDLLEILTQDWEIIREYGKETLETFTEEVSQQLLLTVVVVFIIIVIYVLKTKHKRYIMHRRLQESVNYRTNSKKK